MIKIPFDTNYADQSLTCELDGESFIFRARYNTRSEMWYLSIYDETNDPIFEGLALVLGINFFELVTDERLPAGDLRLFRVYGTGECGRNDLNEDCQLVYSGD